MLMILAAFAVEVVTVHPPPTATTSDLTDAEVRRLLTDSRKLDACRVREADHLDSLDSYRARMLEQHATLLRVTGEADTADAELVAQVETLEQALRRSERRRQRLRLALVAVGSALAGVAVWEGVRQSEGGR